MASLPVASSTAQVVGDSQLSGYAYIDRNNDGKLAFSNQASPELVLPGVEIELYHLVGAATALFKTTTSDSIGRYAFTELPAGVYGLHQIQPPQYVDGLDTVGVIRTLTGALSPPGSSVGTSSSDQFVNIVLPASTRGDLYNVGERGLAPAFVSMRFLLGTAPPPMFAPPPPPPGDLNEDGMVGGADLAQWQNDFGVNGDSDADFDGDSDGADLLIWQRNLEATASLSSLAIVPEPAGGLLVAVAMAAIAGGWRSRR